MNDIFLIPVHSSKHSESVSMVLGSDIFKKSFIKAHNNGHVWGCYLTKGGNVAYSDNSGRSYYNILKK